MKNIFKKRFEKYLKKKPKTTSISLVIAGILVIIFSGIRWFLVFPDFSQAISYIFLGLGVIFVGWAYQRFVETQSESEENNNAIDGVSKRDYEQNEERKLDIEELKNRIEEIEKEIKELKESKTINRLNEQKSH